MKRTDHQSGDADDGIASISRTGVGLSIVLTIIVAATLGTFVLGFDHQPDVSPPKATFEVVFSNDDRTLTIIYRGRDTIDSDRLIIASTVAFTSSTARIDATRSATWTKIAGNRMNVTQGSSIRIVRPRNRWRLSTDFEDEMIRISWRPPDGSDPVPIAEVDG